RRRIPITTPSPRRSSAAPRCISPRDWAVPSPAGRSRSATSTTGTSSDRRRWNRGRSAPAVANCSDQVLRWEVRLHRTGNSSLVEKPNSSQEDTHMADDLENTLILETTKGPVRIVMRPDLAPGHVTRIKELVREGFYNGVAFHRVIEDFMAQTGCPQG